MIFIGKKPVDMRLPSTVPELDQGQKAAANKMVLDGDMLLFSSPGAGKTLTALDALTRLTRRKGSMPRTLVVCPTIAVRNWAVWTQKLFPDASIQIIRGNSDKVLPDMDVLIFTFGTVSRKGSKLVSRVKVWGPEVCIIDESDNLTGLDSNRTEQILGEYGIAPHCEYVWPMTGTPIPRYLDGLWPVLSALFPWRLKEYGVETKTKFMNKFTREKLVKYGGMRFPQKKVVGSQNLDLMRHLLYDAPAICVRNKLVIRSKPMIREVTLDMKPSPELVKLQKAAMSEMVMATDEFGNVFEFVSPETAAALHLYGQELAPAVADAVLALEPKVKGGILLLFWHKAVGRKLSELLTEGGVSNCIVDGSTSPAKADDNVYAFNAGAVKVMIGQIKKMGVALNLQENCNTVCFAEDTYSDAMNLQAYQRVWRRGQRHNVDVIFYKTLMPLADLRPNVSSRKGSDAAKVLD